MERSYGVKLLGFFVTICIAMTILLMISSSDVMMGALFLFFLGFGTLMAVLFFKVEVKGSSLTAYALGLGLGLALLGVCGMIQAGFMGLSTGTLDIGNAQIYMENISPGLQSTMTDSGAIGIWGYMGAIAFQATTVAPAEEMFFGILIPIGALAVLSPRLGVPRALIVTVILAGAIFALFHFSAVPIESSAAPGFYASAFTFRAILVAAYQATGNPFILIGAHTAHNGAIETASFIGG